MLRNGASTTTSVLGAILLIAACSESTYQSNSENQPPRRYTFEEKPERTSELISRVNNLKLGQSFENVVNLLGTPTYDQSMARKGRHAATRLRVVRYYTRIANQIPLYDDSVDRFVELRFDGQNQLVAIWSNIDGVRTSNPALLDK